VVLHVVLVVFVGACVALTDWQVRRAVSGNELSWAYAFEWPFFAAYAIYLWWRLVHEAPIRPGRSKTPAPDSPETNGHGDLSADAAPKDKQQEEEDGELAAYNRYLEELATYDQRHDAPSLRQHPAAPPSGPEEP